MILYIGMLGSLLLLVRWIGKMIKEAPIIDDSMDHWAQD